METRTTRPGPRKKTRNTMNRWMIHKQYIDLDFLREFPWDQTYPMGLIQWIPMGKCVRKIKAEGPHGKSHGTASIPRDVPSDVPSEVMGFQRSWELLQRSPGWRATLERSLLIAWRVTSSELLACVLTSSGTQSRCGGKTRGIRQIFTVGFGTVYH